MDNRIKALLFMVFIIAMATAFEELTLLYPTTMYTISAAVLGIVAIGTFYVVCYVFVTQGER